MLGSGVVLVTGAASGIGLATAKRLAHGGYRVACADIRADACETATRELPGEGHRSWRIDIMDEASVVDTFAAIEGAQGPIYGLVAAAGGLRTNAFPQPKIVDVELDEWDWMERLNIRGTFLCLREYLRCRRRTPLSRGRIVTFGSLAGHVAGRGTGGVYALNKSAIMHLTRTVATESAREGITANAISPGPVDTPAFRAGGGPVADAAAKIAIGRLVEPEEVAALVAYLLSPDASAINGATIDINGGAFMR